MRAALDLTRYAWKKVDGDITVYGTWWFNVDGPVPCLALVPTHARPENTCPCVVPLNQAWVWSEEVGDAKVAARAAWTFVGMLGFDQSNAQNVYRVHGIINDYLGDLVTMKPYTAYDNETKAVADAVITDLSTGKTREAEIFDRA